MPYILPMCLLGGRRRGALELGVADAPVEPLPVRLHGALEHLGIDVDKGDVDAVERRLLGDLGAHGSGADDEQSSCSTVGGGCGHGVRTGHSATGSLSERAT